MVGETAGDIGKNPDELVVDVDVAYNEARVLQNLVKDFMINPKSLSRATLPQLNELIARAPLWYENFYDKSKHWEQRAHARNRTYFKSKVVLNEYGDKWKVSETELKVRAWAMAYALGLATKGEVAGVVIYGSKTNPNKTPSIFSDWDVCLVLKSSNPSSGEKLSDDKVEVIKKWGERLGMRDMEITQMPMGRIREFAGLDQNEMEKQARYFYPIIDRHSVVAIPNNEDGKVFERVFHKQLTEVRNDFRYRYLEDLRSFFGLKPLV